MVGYLFLAYFFRWYKTRQLFSDQSYRVLLPRIFDSATFAASVMLVLGILNDDVLRAIGSTKPFLLVAGLAGILYGIHAIAPDP